MQGTGKAWVMGSYIIIKLDQDPDDVFRLFNMLDSSMIEPFRDATYAPSEFDLGLQDCWSTLNRGKGLCWIILSAPVNSRRWGAIDIDTD